MNEKTKKAVEAHKTYHLSRSGGKRNDALPLRKEDRIPFKGTIKKVLDKHKK